MVLPWGATLLVGAWRGFAQAPAVVKPGLIGRAPEPVTLCAIPLIEMLIDHHAIPLLEMPPLKRTALMPMLRPRVCPQW